MILEKTPYGIYSTIKLKGEKTPYMQVLEEINRHNKETGSSFFYLWMREIGNGLVKLKLGKNAG